MADQQDPKDQNAENQAPAQPAEAPQQPAEPAQPAEAPAQEPAPEQPAAPVESAPTAAPVEQTPPEAAPEAQAAQQQEAPQADGTVPEMLKKAQNQPATTGEERIWALVGYVPMVALISLVMKPDSKFVKLHGQQGLLLLIIFFVSIFFYVIPFVGPVIMLILHLALIAVGLFSMYQAYIGNWWKIPVLGDVAAMIPVDALTKVTRTAVMSEKVDKEKREEAEKPAEQQPTPEQQPPAEQTPPAGNDDSNKPPTG